MQKIVPIPGDMRARKVWIGVFALIFGIILIQFVLGSPDAVTENITVSFDRQLSGERVGQHKAPPLSPVNMEIGVSVSNNVSNATLIDYFPTNWTVSDANAGVISVYNASYNKIEWFVGNISADSPVSKPYVINSPQRTIPPTKYYFQTELVYDNNSAKSDEWMVIVADPAGAPAKVLAGTNRFSVWAPWNKVSNYGPNNQSFRFTVGALVMDVDGYPVSGEDVNFSIYSNYTTGESKANITSTTGLNGIAYANYSTDGVFTAEGDLDYGTWKIEIVLLSNTSINTTRYFQIDDFGKQAAGCGRDLCHHDPSELNNAGKSDGPSPSSPYSYNFGSYGTIYSMAAGGHRGTAQHAAQSCELCHSGYGNSSGAPTDSYPWGAHNSLMCTDSGCHDTVLGTSAPFPPNMPSCYDCHPNNNTNLSAINTTAAVDGATRSSAYSLYNATTRYAAHTNITISSSEGILCWICHGPMHNITKPVPTGTTNSYTEDSQCQVCHQSTSAGGNRIQHNGAVNCTICHSQDAHNISYFNNTGGYTKTKSKAGDCRGCHQGNWTTIKDNSKVIYTGNDAPQIPEQFYHSDDSSAGWKWNKTAQYYWNGSATGFTNSSCAYCHGATFHNATALGRPSLWMGLNTLNSSINATNNWCAGCHYQNYTSGSDNYTNMTGTFEGDNLPVPPEITNHSTYAPDEISGYNPHSFPSSPFYNDSQCKTCHGSLVTGNNITEFVHKVAIGAAACEDCHFVWSTMSPNPSKFINETEYNASVHGNFSVIYCTDCHTNYSYDGTNHTGATWIPPESGWRWCEDCHVVNQSTSDPNRHNLTGDPLNNIFNSTNSVMTITDCTACHDATIYNSAIATYNRTSGKDCRYCHTFPDYDPESPY